MMDLHTRVPFEGRVGDVVLLAASLLAPCPVKDILLEISRFDSIRREISTHY